LTWYFLYMGVLKGVLMLEDLVDHVCIDYPTYFASA
jgi:hypothetical protein